MRLLGVNIPDQKRVEVALTYLYGVGPASSRRILKEVKINPDMRAKDLQADDLNKLKTVIEKQYRVEGELRQFVRQNIARLKDIRSYRGARHARRLPVRGQSTKRNSRTTRGNVRKTAGSGKRKVELK